MPGTFLKLTLACLLLLGGLTLLKAQAKKPKSSEMYAPSPTQLDTDLAWITHQMAALNAQAVELGISPSPLVAFLTDDIVTRIDLESNPKEKSIFWRGHQRMWEEFLKWLGAFPAGEDLALVDPVLKLTPGAISRGRVTSMPLEKVHSELEGRIGPAFDAFYAGYRKMVLKNRRWPSSGNVGCCGLGSGDPYKEKLFKVSQMSLYIGLATWILEQVREARHLVLVRAEMAALQAQRQAEGIELLPFVAFLDSYLELNQPARVGKLWPTAASRNTAWLSFLWAIEVLPRDVKELPPSSGAASFFQVEPWKIWTQVRSEILDKTGPESEDPDEPTEYLIDDLFINFFNGYEAAAELDKVTNRNRIHSMAGFITLGRWAIETWKGEKAGIGQKKAEEPVKKPGKASGDKRSKVKWPKVLKSSNFTLKKGVMVVGGLVAAGVAANYGVPAVWEAIFGTEKPPGGEIETVSEAPGSGPIRKPEVGEEGAEKDPEVYKEDDEDEDEDHEVWIYGLGGLAAVLLISGALVAGCYLYRRERTQTAPRTSTSDSEDAYILSDYDVPLDQAPPGDPPELLAYRPRSNSAESDNSNNNYRVYQINAN